MRKDRGASESTRVVMARAAGLAVCAAITAAAYYGSYALTRGLPTWMAWVAIGAVTIGVASAALLGVEAGVERARRAMNPARADDR